MAQNPAEVTAAEVESLAVKLSDFIDTLTPGERVAFQVVEWYLAMTTLEEEHDVVGFQATDTTTMTTDHQQLWQTVTTALTERQGLLATTTTTTTD